MRKLLPCSFFATALMISLAVLGAVVLVFFLSDERSTTNMQYKLIGILIKEGRSMLQKFIVVASFAVAMLLSAVPAAAASFAVVNLDGSLASGSSDVQSVTYIGTGQYEVTFTIPPTNGAYVATTLNAYSQAHQRLT